MGPVCRSDQALHVRIRPHAASAWPCAALYPPSPWPPTLPCSALQQPDLHCMFNLACRAMLSGLQGFPKFVNVAAGMAVSCHCFPTAKFSNPLGNPVGWILPVGQGLSTPALNKSMTKWKAQKIQSPIKSTEKFFCGRITA